MNSRLDPGWSDRVRPIIRVRLEMLPAVAPAHSPSDFKPAQKPARSPSVDHEVLNLGSLR
jgi:hypothetical protein